MADKKTKEFKRMLRLSEQADIPLGDHDVTLETYLCRHLRAMPTHMVSEFIRSAVFSAFIKEKLALHNLGRGELHPCVHSYIEKQNLGGGAP